MLLRRKDTMNYCGGGAIGPSDARPFAAEGAHVYLAGRTLGKLEKVAEVIRPLVPLAAVLDPLRIGLLPTVVFMVAVLGVLGDAADNAYLPSLVAREHLVEANPKLEASGSVAQPDCSLGPRRAQSRMRRMGTEPRS